MNQTKLGSLIEASINTAIGFAVALAARIALFPLFGIHVPIETNLWLGLWFTVISVARSYIIRRWFNARLHRLSMSLATHQGEGA